MDFEKLGAFYLGKQYDIESGSTLDRLLMYDARDLTTHAVCVGMTGSGKTGLCVTLLEEAAIDKVPAIIIDPKGDMTNLLLSFPELRPEDFRPWLNVDDARRKGMTLDDFAKDQAQLWKRGLGEWGQDGARIKRLRDSVDYRLFTPGSSAGTPIRLLKSFAPPPLSWDTDAEVIRERIAGVTSGLLSLLGIEADPVQSRESILISNLLEYSWRRGETVDIARLILSIQNPPMSQLGVFDLDTFYPQKDRFGLAMQLNNILASPSFRAWMEGHPLEVGSFLFTETGQPRHSIFYIAHLDEAERMFFVSMLLNELIGWIRSQSGTTSLRALLYMDEIFGFIPPVANPPSKKPLLTLLKQARAFGLGVVLATQNPVDLDYKGLTNMGTWFIGRLQTDQDKNRLLDGLTSASGTGTQLATRKEISEKISTLDKRVFLMHNVHDDHPSIFHTRWAMSYLRGPLAPTQIPDLPVATRAVPEGDAVSEGQQPKTATLTPELAADGAQTSPPILPPGLESVYLPLRKSSREAVLDVETREGCRIEAECLQVLYSPVILGLAEVHFVDSRRGIHEREDLALIAQPPEHAGVIRWEEAAAANVQLSELRSDPEPEPLFAPLPDSIDQAREVKEYAGDLDDYLYRSRKLTLFFNSTLNVLSQPNESQRDFQARLSQLAREQRDQEVDDLNRRYEKKLAKLQDRLTKAEISLEKREENASARKREALLNVGESLIGMFFGRRSTRIASSGLRQYRMSSTAKLAAEEAKQTVEALKREIEELEAELRVEVDSITGRWDEVTGSLEEKDISPRRSDVDVRLLSLAWLPQWRVTYRIPGGANRSFTTLAG